MSREAAFFAAAIALLLQGTSGKIPVAQDAEKVPALVELLYECGPFNTEGAAQAASRRFITRSGDRLMEGTTPFRFVSYNIPSLPLNEALKPRTDDSAEVVRAQEIEIEDVFKSMRQSAGLVIHMYALSTQGEFPTPTATAGLRRHVTWDGGHLKLDEQLFCQMDYMLDLANRYGLRLIIPLVAQPTNEEGIRAWGGTAAYGRARGKGDKAFWSDPVVRRDFEEVIRRVLTRINRRTGVPYKDDPAILAWETGVELESDSPEWTEEVARTIKSIDSNHLVMDGHYGIKDESLEATSLIDIVSDHFYDNVRGLSAVSLTAVAAKARGKKPFVAGEFGVNFGGDSSRVKSFLDAVISTGTTGAMLWALRGHSRYGGFFPWCDTRSDSSCAFHWPAFPSSTVLRYQHPEERLIISTVEEAAARIRGMAQRGDGRIGDPDPPNLPFGFPAVQNGGAWDHNLRWVGPGFELRWRGSAGADSYIVERARSPGGPFTQVTTTASDNKPSGSALYVDRGAALEIGQVYYYRIRAQFNRADGTRSVSVPSPLMTSPPASCFGPWPDTDINTCGEGGMDLPYSNNQYSCGQVVVDPCGVSHTCSPCFPRLPCSGDTPCRDGTCPADHGGVCPRGGCGPFSVECSDGSCVKNINECDDWRPP